MDQTRLWRRSLHLPWAESAVKLFLSTICLCNTSITNTDSELTEDGVSRVSKSTMEGSASSYEAHVHDTTFNSWSEGQRKPLIFFKVVLKTLRKFSWLRLASRYGDRGFDCRGTLHNALSSSACYLWIKITKHVPNMTLIVMLFAIIPMSEVYREGVYFEVSAF